MIFLSLDVSVEFASVLFHRPFYADDLSNSARIHLFYFVLALFSFCFFGARKNVARAQRLFSLYILSPKLDDDNDDVGGDDDDDDDDDDNSNNFPLRFQRASVVV
jgi:hypothetical protein